MMIMKCMPYNVFSFRKDTWSYWPFSQTCIYSQTAFVCLHFYTIMPLGGIGHVYFRLYNFHILLMTCCSRGAQQTRQTGNSKGSKSAKEILVSGSFIWQWHWQQIFKSMWFDKWTRLDQEGSDSTSTQSTQQSTLQQTQWLMHLKRICYIARMWCDDHTNNWKDRDYHVVNIMLKKVNMSTYWNWGEQWSQRTWIGGLLTQDQKFKLWHNL